MYSPKNTSTGAHNRFKEPFSKEQCALTAPGCPAILLVSIPDMSLPFYIHQPSAMIKATILNPAHQHDIGRSYTHAPRLFLQTNPAPNLTRSVSRAGREKKTKNNRLRKTLVCDPVLVILLLPRISCCCFARST